MARINLEDDLFIDPRFLNLCIKKGDYEKAIGSLVLAWMAAQKWYLKSENGMIPKKEWDDHKLSNEIIEVGLAEETKGYIKVCGSEEQFKWLKQRVEAGRKGGLTRRGKTLSVQESAKRQAARLVVSKSIERGELKRQSYCEDCRSTKDVHAHHNDYDNPLDIEWLCRVCHNTSHKNLEDNLKKNSLPPAKRPLGTAKPPTLTLTQKKKLLYTMFFEKCWLAFPARNGKKIGKSISYDAFAKKVPQSDHPKFFNAIVQYSKHCKSNQEFAKDMKTFINQKIWLDPFVEKKELRSDGLPR